jgi:hypothetical protein
MSDSNANVNIGTKAKVPNHLAAGEIASVVYYCFARFNGGFGPKVYLKYLR